MHEIDTYILPEGCAKAADICYTVRHSYMEEHRNSNCMNIPDKKLSSSAAFRCHSVPMRL